MGVLNITPDSFSDGGKYSDINSAIKKVEQLLDDGADIIDLGAESSRPGANYVSNTEEWDRLEPILKKIREIDKNISISIDTRKAEIMKNSLKYRVNYINNIEGLTDSSTLKFLAQTKDLSYIAMHMYKSPKDMQVKPLSGITGVNKVKDFFKETQKNLEKAGFKKDKIWLDPGIGFGKDDSANFKLLAETNNFSKEYNLLLGVSRKSFIGRTLEIENPEKRDAPSKMMELGLAMAGAKMIRTHDVKNLSKLRNLLLKDD